MDDKIKKLIVAIKNGEDKLYQLWISILEYEDDYDKEHLKERLMSYSYSHNCDYDDIHQNAFICFMDLLEKFDISKTRGDNLTKSFLAYVHNYLFLRLNDFDDYSLFSDSKILSYDKYDNLDMVDEELNVETINNGFIELLMADNCYDKLSLREKQVYNFLREGFDHGYIAKELNIDARNVHKYKEKIIKKIIKNNL